MAASVRSGAKRLNLSVEFHPLDEAQVSGVREVRQSLVVAVATVPRPELRPGARRSADPSDPAVAWWRR